MIVNIKANPAPGHSKAFAARRGFPASFTAVEVVDLPDGIDPPDVVMEHDGQKYTVADPHKIGRKAFEELKADGRFTILADGESLGVLSQEALDAAKAKASEAAGKVASVEAENEALRQQVAELTAKVAAFEEAGKAASDGGDKGKGKGK